MPAEFPTGLGYQGAIVRTGGTFFWSAALGNGKTFSFNPIKPVRLLWLYIVNGSNTAGLTATDNWYGVYDTQGSLFGTQLRFPVLVKAGTSQLVSAEIPLSSGGITIASLGANLPWVTNPTQSAQQDSLFYGAYQLQS